MEQPESSNNVHSSEFALRRLDEHTINEYRRIAGPMASMIAAPPRVAAAIRRLTSADEEDAKMKQREPLNHMINEHTQQSTTAGPAVESIATTERYRIKVELWVSTGQEIGINYDTKQIRTRKQRNARAKLQREMRRP